MFLLSEITSLFTCESSYAFSAS